MAMLITFASALLIGYVVITRPTLNALDAMTSETW